MKLIKHSVKHLFVLSITMFFAFVTSAFFLEANALVPGQTPQEEEILEFDGTYDWETTLDVQTSSSDYITYADFRNNYCTAGSTASQCASAASGKVIRFDTAESLYRFSVDVSFEEIYITGNPTEDVKLANDKIAVLLDLDYVLGKNLDYSVMQSKAFIPIGYAFSDVEEVVYERSFTGTFDGQGFYIQNLYVAGYDHLIYVDQVDEVTTIDIAMSEHYSMFNYNEGTIENLGLINANLEILELHVDITKLSNLVGFNMSSGIVRNVYVIDTRTTPTTAGMRYQVGTSSEDFQAAGIIHTNQGTFLDSYYVSSVVVNGNYINKFHVQPVLFTNSGTIARLVYDNQVYLYPTVTVGSSTFIIDTPNAYATGEATATLKSTSSSLNQVQATGSDLAFTSASHTISSTSTDLSIFKDGDQVGIEGSASNDGVYTVTGTPTTNSMVVVETLTDESAGESVTIHKEKWFFYPSDGYPKLQGFHYDADNGVYEIDSPIDFAFFARAIQFTSVANGTTYGAADYVLKTDIDMSIVAPNVYQIPTATFTGTLSGYNENGSDLSDNFYIYNLDITQNITRGSEYYGGLFSVLGAGSEISNLNFGQSTVSFTNTNAIYSYSFFIGAIAGKMTGGSISNVLVDVDINLGTEAIGITYAGGVVGKASGVMEYVSNYGDITGGNHVFPAGYSIKPVYNIGGIVGGAELAKLSLNEVVNHGTINGFQTASEITLASGYSAMEIRMGGIIGYSNSGTGAINEMTNVTNHGNIYVKSVTYSVGVPSYQYVGGVFGKLGGLAPILESNDIYKFANLYNDADIYHTYAANTSQVVAAGIGVNDASEAVEYALLFNHGTFHFTQGAATYSQTAFKYVTLIYDVSSSDVTISRSYNYADLTYDSNIYYDISGLYYSTNNNDTLLRYVANYGDISYLSNAGASQISLATNVYIAGITRNSNVSFLNVYNYGDIDVVNINVGTYTLYISGITTQLNSGKYMKNSLNDGDLTFAEMSGSGNIYVGGVANINLSGDLQDPEQSTVQPIATIGILNTINSGHLSTSYGLEAQGLYGINGTSNLFVGGITTMNAGSIQNSANLGDVSLYNSSTSGSANFNTNSYYAGLVTGYSAGIIAGGVVGVVLSGDSRIYDTGNSGEITVVSYRFARAGGVLGVCLYEEASSGGITSGMGLVNDIDESILKNGMNLGNISALTNDIGTYSTSSYTENEALYYNGSSTYNSMYFYEQTTVGTNARPEINASAGGVIGYGLSIMRNMLNHGTISSTDTAGGIVGATYALGASTGSYTTVVNITTAINYGEIKAINSSSYSSIDKFELNYDDYSTYFLADGNTYIYPTGFSPEAPRGKRGFGGIFGRLQRGTNGYMTSNGGSFDFIVNANENIDLIGRLDQVYRFSSSLRFFQFNDATYYSAKLNDTTQVVFTGMYYASVDNVSRSGTVPYYYTSTINGIYQQVGMTYSQVAGSGGTFNYYAGNSVSAPSTTNRYVYYAQIDMPWITEDPDDPNITDMDNQYMYDEDFPMRTDPDLTEYIYFMPNELLASRFTSSRPDGMYVLSTTAGQSYGSVIPKNIEISNIRMIDEDYTGFISLLMDYSLVSPLYKENLASNVETGYLNLRQTTFNDKSEIIPNDSVFVTIEEEAGGSDTILSSPVIDYNNKTITFSISMEAFDSGQTTASYEVTDALISSGALIAQRAYDYYGYTPSQSELEDFRDLLYPEKDDYISTDYPASLDVTLPSYNITTSTTLSIGYFTVYSEAFLGDDLYAHDTYYSDFHVYITFLPTLAQLPGTTQIETVQFNGGGTISASGTTDVRSLGTVNSLGSIRLNFEDTKGVFTQGYDFKDNFVVKYYDGTIVDSSYYTVTSIPVDIVSTVGYYSITFTFIDTTRMGDYYFEYRYFPTSTLYTCYFDKAASTVSSLLDFGYYSDEDSISYDNFTITSYLNFGLFLDMDTSTGNWSSSTDNGLPSYVSNVTYDIDFMTPDTLSISPFAEVISARLVSTSITDGYKTYQLEYTIQAEDGSSQSVYTHNLIERTVDLVSVLKDGNDVELDSITVTREADETEMTVDLGFDQTQSLYVLETGSYTGLEISVSGTTNDGLTTYTPEEIVGITYSASDYLYIYISYETLPGIYTFSFKYYRDGSSSDYVTFVTELEITKSLGQNAYLIDIAFSELANETTYPDINLTDQYGVIVSSSYDPAIYFDGIDYDGADEAMYPYFKIDGRVSNVPLDSYVPFFLEYLPYGATISRHAYDFDTSSWYWTTEADADSEGSVLDELATSFTEFPDTGLEPGVDPLDPREEVVIEYRVTAEDGITSVYYFITVTDVTYNLSIVFDIYYCTDETQGSCSLANESVDFSNELVIITVKNIDTNGDDTVWGVSDPDDFPTFSVVNELNNRMTQFYYTSDSEYNYKFGRNMAGFYTFSLELPLDIYLNDLYSYDIEFGEYYLNDASDYVSGLDGKYFYIEYATSIRTRRFNIYIHPIAEPETGAPFGLFDFFKSWFED
ncbi:MAG: hypothetical protein JXL85_09885 [Bacilli bacterium]|nr:hypothetical protein [Bacilli bacterium]